MKLCDLHADTAYELYTRSLHIDGDSTDITLDGIRQFDSFLQLSAVCASSGDTDSEAWEKFIAVSDYFGEEAERFSLSLCKTKRDIVRAVESDSPAFIMTVEDARILEGNISRLDELFLRGVRVITPLWGGDTVVGGSHDTENGLTPFGRDLMHGCAEYGIITDISHASYKSADEILNIAVSHGMPVIASHSCAAHLCSHSRNLHFEHFDAVAQSGGIVGCNLYPQHLTDCGKSSIDDVLGHLDYYCGRHPDSVALGCDFDGMGDCKTEGLESLSDLKHLYSALGDRRNDIFWNNAYSFLIHNIAE